MSNKFLININTKEDWQNKAQGIFLDKYFLVSILIGLSNIIFEIILNRFFIFQFKNTILQLLHLILFFLIPSFLIFKSFKKSFLFFALLFLIIIPLNFFIEIKILNNHYSIFFILSWLLFYLFFRENKKTLKEIFLGKNNYFINSIYGLLIGFLFCSHIFLVLWFSKNINSYNIDFAVFLNYIFLEVSFSLIGMEFLFRYLLFLRPIQKNKLGFLSASFLSSFFVLGIFLINSNLNKNIGFSIATSFYTLIQNFISCYLAYKTKSILPSILFALIVSLFLSIIIY